MNRSFWLTTLSLLLLALSACASEAMPAAEEAEEAAPAEAVEVAAEVTETEVITFLPEEIPTESEAGACFTSALGLGREDAYRCMVENNIYDPCFVVDDDNEEPTVICGADPTTGETGFILELTEPLPEPDLGNLAQPWLIELADGTTCGILQGTRPGNEEIIGAYGCTDQTYLGEEFREGDVWQAEQVRFDLGDDGFVVTDLETVAVRRVWR